MNTPNVDSVILELIAHRGQISGKKVFQKLCYFLQEAEGVPMGLRFRMKHFGPFSEDLDDRLEDLAERKIVNISGRGDEGFVIQPGPRCDEVEASSPASEQIGAVVSKLGEEGGLTVELLATIHFLGQAQPYQGTERDKTALVQRVRAWKGPKFEEYFIRDNIRKLEELGYLPSARSDS